MPRRSRRASAAPPPARRPSRALPAIASIAVGAAALAIDLWLAPHVTGDQDASELTLAVVSGGVPHPSGYPLYAIFGHAWCVALHALGADWSFAINAWSALGAAVAIGLFHALASRIPDPTSPLGPWTRFSAALAVAVIAALHPVWTMVAALAEVHSWHLAWVAGLALVFLTLLRGVTRAQRAWSDRAVGLGALLWGGMCGIGLAHHMTGMLLALPLTAALAYALVRERRWRWTLIVHAIAGALPPLASYGFIVYRAFHPAPFQWPMLEPSLASVARHVLGGGYGRYFGHFAPADIQGPLLETTVYPLLAFGFVALAIAVWRSKSAGERIVRVALTAAAALQTVAVFEYGVPDPAAYFLPAIWIGLLAVPIAAGALARRGLASLPVAATGLAAALVGGPWLRQAVDRREAFGVVDAHLRAVWRGIPFERGIVLWPRDMYCRFREYQMFDGEKPGIFVTSPNLLTFDAPRRDFIRRFGIDPLAGLTLRSSADLGEIAGNINRQTALPVAEVDRFGFAATVLTKPAR
jgi:hypothetical protein